jgi:hypothetical protein
MPLASVTIQNFTKFLMPETELVCPACHSKPEWHGGYKCQCGKEYNHWSQLKRVVKSTGQEIVKQRFTSDKAPVTAQAYIMTMEEFAKYVDATYQEYGVKYL